MYPTGAGRVRNAANIRIDGVKETTRALQAFEPEIKKRLNKTIRQALEIVKGGAEMRYPKGAWQIRINTRNILGSITTKPGTVGGRRWGDADPGVRAAIFEFAGSTGKGATPQAAGLIESLNIRYGQPGRFLWAAWDANGKAALDTIRDAVYLAERELQTKLDAAGEAY